MKRVVRHSIPTLRTIIIKGDTRGVDSRNVAAVLGELVPLSAKRHRVAPLLTRVTLADGSNAVAKAGKAIAAGLWPSLQELFLSHCHANAGHFKNLAVGLSSGRAPMLRVLNWDGQTNHRETPLDVVILSALAAGKCPHIQCLSFTNNKVCPEYRIDCLRDALRACPNLRELRMDCSRSPRRDAQVLTRALKAGETPRLASLFIRSTTSFGEIGKKIPNELPVLKREAAARVPPVHFVSQLQIRRRMI